MPLPRNWVLSQRVAAKFTRARSGSVPTHGPTAPVTGGRSTAASSPEGVPTG